MFSTTEVPSYPKILSLGARFTEAIFANEVVIQEKVDGSQFGFMWDDGGELRCRSHHQQIDVADPPTMFAPAVNHLVDWTRRNSPIANTVFYCEYLGRPKHNTLVYNRIPRNHLVLFDVVRPFGAYTTIRKDIEETAQMLEIDVAPELYRGRLQVAGDTQIWMNRESFLGGPTVEGIVIKCYGDTVCFGNTVMPLFCKQVNPQFKERNEKEWKKASTKGQLEDYLDSFAAEPRWTKAVQRMAEDGSLQEDPRDIGTLIKLVQKDIEEEESENIKRRLYAMFIGDVKKRAVLGLAEWYKARLLAKMAP